MMESPLTRRPFPAAERSNGAAVVSFCCALVLPLAAARAYLSAHSGVADDGAEATLGVLLGLCSVPAALVAVVAGHRALLRARRQPAMRSYARLAWCGLLGGYLCAAIIFGARVAPLLPPAVRTTAHAITTTHVPAAGRSLPRHGASHP